QRASGDVQKLQELARTSTSTSFGDIRWDTDNGSPNLCSQPEPLFRGETVRKGINLTRQFHRLLPNHQIVMWSRHPLPPIAASRVCPDSRRRFCPDLLTLYLLTPHLLLSSFTSVNSASTTSSGDALPPPGACCAPGCGPAWPPACAAANNACAASSSLVMRASIAA